MSDVGGSLSRKKAYNQALQEFYKSAALLDIEAAEYKKLQLKSCVLEEVVESDRLSMPDKPWTEAFMREEKVELEDGHVYANDQNIQYCLLSTIDLMIRINARRASDNQMSQFSKSLNK